MSIPALSEGVVNRPGNQSTALCCNSHLPRSIQRSITLKCCSLSAYRHLNMLSTHPPLCSPEPNTIRSFKISASVTQPTHNQLPLPPFTQHLDAYCWLPAIHITGTPGTNPSTEVRSTSRHLNFSEVDTLQQPKTHFSDNRKNLGSVFSCNSQRFFPTDLALTFFLT